MGGGIFVEYCNEYRGIGLISAEPSMIYITLFHIQHQQSRDQYQPIMNECNHMPTGNADLDHVSKLDFPR